MKVVAILQNAWFKDPQRIAEIYAKHAASLEKQCWLTAAYLFMGCLTGRRLRQTFGEDLCEHIEWAEASPRLGAKSSDAFPAEPQHIAKVIRHFNPGIVIGFGKIAANGVLQTMPLLAADTSRREFYFTSAPHPAARHATVMDELRKVAADVKGRLGWPA
jgi:hypothetical protein